METGPGKYKVVSPIGKTNSRRASMAPPLSDLSGKTFAAMRHTFRADETFEMIADLLKKKYANVTFISNHDMPDIGPVSPQQEAGLIKVFRENSVDVVLAGNGA